MRSIVKVSWSDKPRLKLASEKGFEYLELEKGREPDLEISDERRCTGFHSDRGQMEPCPDFREIDSGDQCRECRRKDIYSDWRTGDSEPDFEAEYSVYLVQCGEEVKVGVTRSSRLMTRWKEQGADYGVEIHDSLSGRDALNLEAELSEKGLKERIRKEKKAEKADKRVLRKIMAEYELEGDIETVLPNCLSCGKVVRKGVFPSPIEAVKGQIVSNGSIGLALTSGKVVRERRQRGLKEF